MCENLMTLSYHDGTPIPTKKVRAYDDYFTNAWTETILTTQNLFGYILVNGYNNLTLPSNACKSGNFTFSVGTTEIVLPIIYKDNSEYERDPIYWLLS